MTEIASLGLSIRSDGVVVATDRLKDFEGAGRRAEGVSGSLARAVSSLSDQADGASKTASKVAGSLGLWVDAAGRIRNESGQFASAQEKAQAAAAGFSSALGDQERSAVKTKGALSELERAVLKMAATVAGAFSVRALQQYADAWSDMQSRVGAAVKDMESAPALMQRMVDLANASYSPLEQTVEVYTRNVGVLRDLGVSAAGAADFTESLNHMLVITATRGERAASVQNALSKAMATGRLQADGLETVLANGGRVAEALANELGTTVSGLRAMSSQGKITGDVIKNALLNSLEDVRAEAAEMPATIGDAFTRIQTNTTALIGTLDQAWGVSGRVAEQLLAMADGIRASADTYLRLGNIVGSVVGPAFEVLSANMGTIASVATVAVAAVAGFYAPAMISGLWATATALRVGIAGAIATVSKAMMANPLGLLIAGLAAAVTAAFMFRDQIKQAVGVDVVEVAKAGGNMLIQAFDLAFRNIGTIWGALPSVLGDITISTANAVIGGIQSMINGAIGLINDFTRGARDALGAIGLQVGDIGEVSIGTFDNPYAESLGGLGEKLGQNLKDTSGIDYLGGLASMLGDVWTNADGASGAIGALAGQLGEGESEGGAGAGGGLAGAAGAANDNLKAANDNIWSMTEALSALGPATVDPLTLAGNQIRDLNDLLAQGKLSWEQYGEAAYRANAGAMSSVLGLASGMTGALAQMFQDNKAFAVANAVVSTAEAVMKAMATYGPTPWGFAAAGVAAATGAAQIATILSAQKGSSSVSRPSGSASSQSQTQAQAQRAVQLNVTLGGAGRYSRDEVRDLLEQLADGLYDGVDQGNFKIAVNS